MRPTLKFTLRSVLYYTRTREKVNSLYDTFCYNKSMKNSSHRGRKGRPPSDRAASHAAIMDTVYALLQEKSVRDLTMEEVAKRAKVGKPTLYKWWPTKATLVLAMLCERMAPNLEKPSDRTAEESLRLRVRSLINAFNGPFAKIRTPIICTMVTTRKIQSSVSYAEENHEKLIQAQEIAKLAKPKPISAVA